MTDTSRTSPARTADDDIRSESRRMALVRHGLAVHKSRFDHEVSTALLAHESGSAPAHEEVGRRKAEAEAKFEVLVGLHGVDAEEILQSAKAQHGAELRSNLDQWVRTRMIHLDFIENPELYNWEDHAGHPLDMEQQRQFVAQYDAAIATARAWLEGSHPAATS